MVFGLIHSIYVVEIKRIFKKIKFVLLLTEIYTLLYLLAYSPNMPRVSLRLLHVRIDFFRVFGDNSAYNPTTTTLHSLYLHIRLNTFLAFSLDAQIHSAYSQNMQKE
jgi:hypothetical protein